MIVRYKFGTQTHNTTWLKVTNVAHKDTHIAHCDSMLLAKHTRTYARLSVIIYVPNAKHMDTRAAQ